MLTTRIPFVRRVEKSNESSIQTNFDDSQTSNVDPSATNISDALVNVQQMMEKQNLLEEKLTNLRNEMLTRDSIDEWRTRLDEYRSLFDTIDSLKNFDDEFFEKKLRFFRTYFSVMCPNTNHWKFLAHGLVRLENLIKNFENFQLKKLLQTNFSGIFDEFLTLMKNLLKNFIEKKRKGEDNENSVDDA